MALVGMISIAVSTIYDICSLFLGKHWSLGDDESSMMASSLDRALSTLPDKYYGLIREHIEKTVPWIAVIITAIAITYPRIEESRRRFRNRQEVEGEDQGHRNGASRQGSTTDDFTVVTPSFGNPQ